MKIFFVVDKIQIKLFSDIMVLKCLTCAQLHKKIIKHIIWFWLTFMLVVVILLFRVMNLLRGWRRHCFRRNNGYQIERLVGSHLMYRPRIILILHSIIIFLPMIIFIILIFVFFILIIWILAINSIAINNSLRVRLIPMMFILLARISLRWSFGNHCIMLYIVQHNFIQYFNTLIRLYNLIFESWNPLPAIL